VRDGDEVDGTLRIIIPMIALHVHRSTTTMVRAVQRLGSIHRRPATALAAFYWAAATWAASSSPSPSSSSSIVVFGFGGTGGSPTRGFGIPSQRRHSIWTTVSNICCGSTVTKSIEDTTTATTTTIMSSAQSKVDALRVRMKELGLQVYLVPTDDPHLSGTRKNNTGGDH
jgi:hypothetical protein